MPQKPPTFGLGRREREIMEIVYRLGQVTAADVQAHLSDPLSDSSVRTMLRHLEGKGHLRHVEDGQRYVYTATMTPEGARRSALRHLVETFFDGSEEAVVSTLLRTSGKRLRDAELDRIARLVDEARRTNR